VVADPEAPQPVIQVLAYGPQNFDTYQPRHAGELRALLEKQPVTWVNVDGLGDAGTIVRIGEIFGLHRLALEDVVNVHQRAKVDDYGEQLFIVARMPETRQPLTMEQISLFLGRNFVLTFQERPGDCFEPVRDRIRAGHTRLRASGPDHLAYALLDAIIDSYFPVLEHCIERLEALEVQIVRGSGQDIMAPLHDLTSDFLLMRRAIWPLRDAIYSLRRDQSKLVSNETAVYLQDCYDHTLQIMDLVESHHEVARNLMQLHLVTASHRMGEVMRVLTIVSTIFIPLTFVVGVYGMNFNTQISAWNMPELNWPLGYPLVLVLMAAIAVGMLFFFRRKGWLGTQGMSFDENSFHLEPESTPPPGQTADHTWKPMPGK
jgi:magnesium transporter